MTRLLFTAFLGSLAALIGCSAAQAAQPADKSATRPATNPALHRFEYHALKMGSDFNLVFYAPDQSAADAARDAVYARVDALTMVLSDYEAESEISRLNHRTHDGPMTQPVAVSDDLWNVLIASKTAYEQSGGAFDITVGPLVQLWKRSRRQQEVPTPERIADTRASIGFDKVKLDAAHHTVMLTAAKMRLDVGGIATGYISDDCLQLLKKRGIARALIDGSGDVAIGDPPPGRKGWRIAIQSLMKPNEAAAYVELANCGISTSGDTYRFVEIDGVRYSHIVDPKTGLGLTRRIGSTVIAPNDLTADWMATAVCVLGPEKGMELIEKTPGVAARITTLEGEQAQVAKSKRYFEQSP
jgi:thiamine biosynthesis lipoprotein